jgi:branched-chain amino acid transport system substrate-binding protein
MRRIIGYAVLALTLSASPLATANAAELLIGYLTATTGPFVGISRSNQIAARIAIDQINAKGGVDGNKLRLITFDTSGKPDQAVVGLRKLADDDKVLAVIGPFSSSEVSAVFPAGERAGIVTMSMASSAPKLAAPYKYAFRNTSDEGYMFGKLLQTLASRNLPRVTAAIAYATDDTISKVMGTAVLPNTMKKAGIDLKGSVSFELTVFDLSPQVSQLAQLDPDLVGVGSPADAAIKLVKEMRRQGVKSRIVAGSTIADPDLPAKMGTDGNGTLVTTTFLAGLDDNTRAFAADFAQRAKAEGNDRIEPSQFDASTYDIVRFYAWAIQQAHITGDPAKLGAERMAIRDALRGMKNLPALEGAISIGEDGDALKPVYIIEMKDNKWQLLDKYPAG